MALVIASGVILGDADSYISVAAADSYHASLQNDEWLPVDLARKEALLRRASIILNARYRGRWQNPSSYTAVPRELEIATAEAALYSVTQDLLSVQPQAVRAVSIGSLSVAFDSSGNQVKTQAGIPTSIWEFLDMLLAGVASTSTSTSNGWEVLTVVRS